MNRAAILIALLCAPSLAWAQECFPEHLDLPLLLNEPPGLLVEGTAAAERFCAGASESEVEAGRGDDFLQGGERVDRLRGGEGDDWIDGGAGGDFLRGDVGDDRLAGGLGLDRLDGGDGRDLLFGDWAHDRLFGGAGDDELDGGPGDDWLSGGEGADRLSGGVGDDTFVYRRGDGDDIVIDSSGANRLVLQRIRPEWVSETVVGADRVLHIDIDGGGTSGALTLLGAALPCTACSWTIETDNRPSVVLIFVDDLGWGDLGSYGQQLIRTPELDAMAREGRRFRQFYSAAPHCAPARGSLFTGLHTGHSPIRHEETLVTSRSLLSQGLQAAGYVVGMFGKWGLSALEGDVPVEAVPHELGFDEFVGQLTHRDAHAHYLDSPPEPPGAPEHPYYPDIRQFLFQVKDGRTVPLRIAPDRYVPDEMADRALEFIATHRDEPFFLYLPWTLPHAELVAPEDSVAAYLDAEGRSVFPETPWTPALDGDGYDRHNAHPRATYAAMVSRLSAQVGRLLDRLRELEIEGETLVLFTSDNGPHDAGGIIGPEFFDSNGPFSGRKWSLREGGLRVPMLAWWPGRVEPGVVDSPTALWDLYPTIAELAGLVSEEVDGVSLLPLFAGKVALLPRTLYWETWASRASYRQAILRGRYKLLRTVGGRLELYDIESDPDESENLVRRPALCDLVREIATLMMSSRRPPERNPNGIYDLSPPTVACP